MKLRNTIEGLEFYCYLIYNITMFRHFKDFSNKYGSYQIEYADDEVYLKEAAGVIENSQDYNIKENVGVSAGIYDAKIFGALNKCVCGRTRVPANSETITKCPFCRVPVMNKKSYEKRFAVYKLGHPYSYSYKLKILINHLFDVGIELVNDKATISSTENERLIKQIWSLEFVELEGKVRRKDNKIETDEDITFIMDSGAAFKVRYVNKHSSPDYIGLRGLKRMADYSFNGHSLGFIRNYINQILYISSPALRPVTIRVENKKILIGLPQQSIYYKIIIESDQAIRKKQYKGYELANMLCLLNILYDRIGMNSKLLASSKQSLLRNALNVRLDLSLRGNISPDNQLRLDEIGVPKSALYLTMQHQIIEELKKDPDPHYALNAEYYYTKNDSRAWDIMYALLKDGCAIFQRSPVLHKLGALALRVIPIESDTPVIKMNPVLAAPFNADYDGDQMMVVLELNPITARGLLQKMSPERLWRYDKNGSPIWTPDHEQLIGLIYASIYKKPVRMKKYINKNQVYEDVKIGKLPIDELVQVGRKQTTYGRLKLEDILGMDIDYIIDVNSGASLKEINKSNIADIIGGLEFKPNKIEIINQLIELSNEFATTIGIDTPPRKDLLKGIDDSIKYIKEDESLTEEQKLDKINSVIEKELKDQIKKLPNTNFDIIFNSSGRVKMQQLKGLYAKNVYQDINGKTQVGDSTILGGLSEKDLYLAAQNARAIFKVKKDAVPINGYDTRQLEVKLNKFGYSPTKAPGSYGVKVPRTETAFQGRDVIKQDAHFTYYRSMVARPIDYKIYSNEFRKDIFLPNIKDMYGNDMDIDSRLAQSWAQIVSEGISQASLGLKYGAAEIYVENENAKALFDGEIISKDDNWLVVKDDVNREWKYILTQASTVPSMYSPGKNFKKGDTLIVSNNIRNIKDLNGPLAEFFGFQIPGKKIKENTFVSYAFSDSTIQYTGKFCVCGNLRQGINQALVYKFPQGWPVKYGDRISSGILNLAKLLSVASPTEAFYLFYKEFLLLVKNNDTPPELIEPIFTIIVNSKRKSLKSYARERTDIIDSMYGESPKQAFTRSTLSHPFKKGSKTVQEHEGTPLTDLMLRLYS